MESGCADEVEDDDYRKIDIWNGKRCGKCWGKWKKMGTRGRNMIPLLLNLMIRYRVCDGLVDYVVFCRLSILITHSVVDREQ